MEGRHTEIITPGMLRAVGTVDEFKGRWSRPGILPPERLAALQRVATVETVGSSIRLDGAAMDDRAVERLLFGPQARAFASRDEQEAAGCADALEMVVKSWRDIGLTEHHVRLLHGFLLRHAERDARHRGRPRSQPLPQDVFLEAVPAVPDAAPPDAAPSGADPEPSRRLAALLADAAADLDGDRVHPLLAIAAVTGGILAIQPFQDGNGRLSRLLATLLLLKHGYAYATSASLDRVFEDERAAYDEAARRLRDAGAGEDGAANAAWSAFFLDCLARQVTNLMQRIDQEQRMAPLPPLSEMIFAAVRSHGRVTVRAATALTGANRNTVKAHLQRLVAEGRLARRGQRKGTWYELPGDAESSIPATRSEDR
ncbi:MAG: Fic family protein [bacterium]|nr:Fic family protein [bacterium]